MQRGALWGPNQATAAAANPAHAAPAGHFQAARQRAGKRAPHSVNHARRKAERKARLVTSHSQRAQHDPPGWGGRPFLTPTPKSHLRQNLAESAWALAPRPTWMGKRHALRSSKSTTDSGSTSAPSSSPSPPACPGPGPPTLAGAHRAASRRRSSASQRAAMRGCTPSRFKPSSSCMHARRRKTLIRSRRSSSRIANKRAKTQALSHAPARA